VRASKTAYVLDDRTDAPPALGWSDDGARGLKIESDRETYAAGDTAKILVRSPFKEADALVTVERAGILWEDVVHLHGPMPVVTVPIAASYVPNVFVGVHLVRGVRLAIERRRPRVRRRSAGPSGERTAANSRARAVTSFSRKTRSATSRVLELSIDGRQRQAHAAIRARYRRPDAIGCRRS
jgi:hypothetical protein